jgi:leucyl aminopeptidase
MTIYEHLILPDTGQEATPLHLIDKNGFGDWLKDQSEAVRTLIAAQDFDADTNDFAFVPCDQGAGFRVIAGVSDINNLGHWSLSRAAAQLPAGTYRLADCDAGDAMLGWMLGHYAFDRYRSELKAKGARILLVRDAGKIDAMAQIAAAVALTRDLVNTPAADLGPAQLEAEVNRIAKANKATVEVIKGDALETGYPLIHNVGKAAAREFAPRLIEMEWGDPRHPRIAVIGKGVTFDSGGLDMKSATGMRIMKKDMGGAAHAIALAQLIMQAHLPVRLHLLIAAVENSVAGNAFRPGDIIKSRKGITVEIDNTDAEGRLVLADALTKALEGTPELMMNFATLTGAARVALGPELPALFVNDEAFAGDILAASKASHDPVWRMPLWAPYDDMLSSDIADTANSGGSFAGAVTAALFLQKFVPDTMPWAHFDTYAWRPAAKPGRPKGGEALGLRAAFRYLLDKYPVR